MRLLKRIHLVYKGVCHIPHCICTAIKETCTIHERLAHTSWWRRRAFSAFFWDSVRFP